MNIEPHMEPERTILNPTTALAEAATAMVLICCVARLPAQETEQKPPAKTARETRAKVNAQAIEFERKLNLGTYQKKYRLWREAYAQRYLGKWVVIASGKLLPVRKLDGRSKGYAFRPGDTLESAVESANKIAPDARHRFVFRIGEEGNQTLDNGATTSENLLGNGFMLALPGHAVLSGHKLTTTWMDKPLNLELDRYSLTTRLTAPVGGEPNVSATLKQGMRVSTVYSGIGTVSADVSDKLMLQLWEIPGKVEIKGALMQGVLRRARVRMAFARTKYEMVSPVAVWPRSAR